MIKQLTSSIYKHFDTYKNGLSFFTQDDYNKSDTTNKMVVSLYGPIFVDGFVFITINCLIRINKDENNLYSLDEKLDYLKDYFESIQIYSNDGLTVIDCLERTSGLEVVKIGLAEGMLEGYIEAEFKTMEE